MHGSLSLYASEFLATRNPGETIAWLQAREQPRYAFDPDAITSNFKSYLPIRTSYTDIAHRIIAPVPKKTKGLNQVFIQAMYNKARDLVRADGTLVAIGYSFNVHDRASYSPILQALCESNDRILVIVAPDARRIAKALAEEYQDVKAEAIACRFKEWASASFPNL